VLVTTVAVAVAAGMVVMAIFGLRLRDEEAAAQAPVHTAMTTMAMKIPIKQSGTRTPMTIPATAALVIPEVKSVKKNHYRMIIDKQIMISYQLN
jgi:Flp pilus assembly protein protease CpaA